MILIGADILDWAHNIGENKLVHGVSGIVVQLHLGVDETIADDGDTGEIVTEVAPIAHVKSGLLDEFRCVGVNERGLKVRQETRILP